MIELKNATDENPTLGSAYKQLQTYKEAIPALFTYNSELVISGGLEAKAGSLSAGLFRNSSRMKVKVIVKRTLRQYGYPPDMQKMATETVLKQAEMLANELSKNA